MHNSIFDVILQRRAELTARRAKFDELFERREEEMESKTYDLSRHLVTVTEVAEVDLADEGRHLGCNQVRARRALIKDSYYFDVKKKLSYFFITHFLLSLLVGFFK